MKTFFNMLGPMVNPSYPGNQLIGVFSLDVARLYNYIYQDSGINFTIIQSLDGYDEISLTSPFKVYNSESERTITPEETGLSQVRAEEIYGGETVEASSKIFIDILQGKGSQAQNHAVIANAAFALQTLDSTMPLDSAVEKAQTSLLSGKALEVFNKLIELQK